MKQLPTPTVDSTSMSPPKHLAICLQMLRPRPFPFGLQFLLSSFRTRKNGWNNCFEFSFEMPMPSSATEIETIHALNNSKGCVYAVIMIFASIGEYLIAFVIRFIKTCCKRITSIWNFFPFTFSIRKMSQILLRAILSFKMRTVSVMISQMSASSNAGSTKPFSRSYLSSKSLNWHCRSLAVFTIRSSFLFCAGVLASAAAAELKLMMQRSGVIISWESEVFSIMSILFQFSIFSNLRKSVWSLIVSFVHFLLLNVSYQCLICTKFVMPLKRTSIMPYAAIIEGFFKRQFKENF